MLRISLTVADLARTQAFYTDALGFNALGPAYALDPPPFGAPRAWALRMRLGTAEIEFIATQPPGAAYPLGSSSADLWFQHFAIVTPDIGASYARLSAHPFTPISEGGPQSLPAASGGATAFKFRDPDGHPLELIQFAGPPRPAGIDHSAISVADADRSIAFYTALGLSVAARQVNTGPEQDRLDGLAQARLDVVALTPAAPTPHIELLGYHHPVGRSIQLQPGDIAATRLVLGVDRLPDGATSLHDPDGHALILEPIS